MSDATAAIRIDIVSSGAESGAKKVNASIDSIIRKAGLAAGANDNLSSSYDKVQKATGNAATHSKKLGAALDEIRGRAAGAVPAIGNLLSKLMAFGPEGAVIAAVALGIAAIGTAAVRAAAQVETWKANLLTMTKSTQAADAAYRGLVDFAAKTPFSLQQSVEGFTKLRALGLATSEEIMTSYGNTAAAMGKTMSQMIEAVADATTGEFERLKEFGIKAKQSGDQVSFTFQGVTKTVGKNSKEIQDYLVGIGKTNFGGAMARQMATAQGAFANLEDQIFNTLAAMGDGILNKTVGKVTNAVTSGLAAITPLLSGIMDVVGGILSAAWDIGSGLLSAFTGGATGAASFKTILDSLSVTLAFIGEGIRIVGSVVGSVFGFIGNITGMVIGGIQSSFGDMFSWLVPTTSDAGQTMGESFVGILRAASYVAGQLPNIFKVALAELKSMFMSAGAALSASLTGDFSKWGKVDLSMGLTRKTIGTVMGFAGKIQQDQKSNRAWIDRAKGVNDKGNITFAAMGTDKPTPAKDKGGKDKAASDAERRAKQEKEFWEALDNQVKTAKLLPLAAEDYAKQLELQKILGRDLVAGEKERVSTLLQQARTAKFYTDQLDQQNNRGREIANDEALLAMKKGGMSDEQLDIEKTILGIRAEALKSGMTEKDLQSDTYKLTEATTRAQLERAGAIAKSNKQLEDGLALAKEYSQTYQKADAAKTAKDQLAALDVAYNNGNNGGKISDVMFRETKDGIERAARAGALKMKEEFGAAISNLGDELGGQFGKFLNSLGNMLAQLSKIAEGDFSGMGGVFGGLMNTISKWGPGGKSFAGDVGKAFSDSMGGLFSAEKWSNPIKSMSDGFGELKSAFSGPNGSFMKGLGSVIGKAGAGMEMGGMADSLLKGLGVKSSKTGAQIGGALGSAFLGPIGGAIGGILGGLVGGVFKKTKYATASVAMMAGGDLGVGSLKGNSDKREGIANDAATSVISGLEQLAASLGGSLTGSPSVSIGTYDDKWRVSTTGYQGKLKKGKSGVVDFGKDGAEEAIKFAIQDALKDGVITGISEFSKRVLSTMDIDKATNLATSYEAILTDLAKFKDPIKGAVDETVKSIDTLIDQMRKAGATSEELANAEQWRSIKLDEVLKDQTSSFRDILDQLNGDAGGFTALSQLTTELGDFDKFKTDIAAGKAVDQDAYSDLVNKIMGHAGDIYGVNTSQYQDIIGSLRDNTTGALANATNTFNAAATKDTTAAAISTQTDQVTASIGVTNDYLAQMLEAIKALGFSVPSSGSVKSVNGSMVQVY